VSWPVSVQVCTLNEEANISACLEAIRANDPADILVIDGGSADRTVEIARSMGARVIEAGPIGLARQRRLGYLDSPCPLVAFVDADDRIAANWLSTMVSELESGSYSALQSLLRVPEPHNFWTGGWDGYFQESVRPVAETIMVGRPALYRTEALLGIASAPGMIIEDTEMSRDFQSRGLRQGIGTAISYRYCPDSADENLRKWRGYGRGYRQFVTANPDRRTAILRHMTWTIPVTRTIRPFLRGHVTQPVFGFLMASSALRGYFSS
jgi:glycosyltransferase involved in cell wall biosynthesis